MYIFSSPSSAAGEARYGVRRSVRRAGDELCKADATPYSIILISIADNEEKGGERTLQAEINIQTSSTPSDSSSDFTTSPTALSLSPPLRRLTRTSPLPLISSLFQKADENLDSDHAKLLTILLDLSKLSKEEGGGKSKESVELAVSLLCVEGSGVGSKVLELVGMYLSPSPPLPSSSTSSPSPFPTSPTISTTASATATTTKTTNGTALALSFAQCLSALQYPHFKSLIRPLLLQNLSKYWEEDKERTIDALCTFWEGALIGGDDVDGDVRGDVRVGLEEWVGGVVEGYEKNGLEEAEETVCPFLFFVVFLGGVLMLFGGVL